MTVNLSKNETLSLTKEVPGLTRVAIGLGWDAPDGGSETFDLDASALMCGADGNVLSDEHFVFYRSPLKNADGTIPSPDGSILHTGDNLTGDGDGDDEIINVNLPAVPTEVTTIFFAVSIYDADKKHQTFGQVENAYIRALNIETGTEITRYALKEDAKDETAMMFGELYRDGTEWNFRAVGVPYASGLAGIARDHGVHV